MENPPYNTDFVIDEAAVAYRRRRVLSAAVVAKGSPDGAGSYTDRRESVESAMRRPVEAPRSGMARSDQATQDRRVVLYFVGSNMTAR
jgi:hypothetical protein